MVVESSIDPLNKNETEVWPCGPLVKDRQHRSRGGLAFSFITQEPKGIKYRVIYQMKAYIFLYPMILVKKRETFSIFSVLKFLHFIA